MLGQIDFKAKKTEKSQVKEEYKQLVDKLVYLQQKASRAALGVVVLFEGWNGAGKGSRISDIMYNLDARSTSVYTPAKLNANELEKFAGLECGVTNFDPGMKEFWSALGARGTMTFYDGGWYTRALEYLRMRVGDPSACVRDIQNFERQITNDGYILTKFFVHISPEVQKKRLYKLKENQPWRVKKQDLKQLENYDKDYNIYNLLIDNNNLPEAPWVILNGEDRAGSNLKIIKTLVDDIEARLNAALDPADAAAAEKARANSAGALSNAKTEAGVVAEEVAAAEGASVVSGEDAEGGAASAGDAPTACAADGSIAVENAPASCAPTTEDAPIIEKYPSEIDAHILEKSISEAESASKLAPHRSRFVTLKDYPRLDGVDYALVLTREDYKKQLKEEQKRLGELEIEMYQRRIPMIIMYEGQDAAGKGGNIKRVAQALDARAYTIFPSPAPTKPELMHPHLWRYWTRLPKAGHVGIYDRSWYGRVLVERVEGFASPAQWTRAYDEINEFECSLVDWGAILLKFWVEIDAHEQLLRFKAREENPLKQWKITDEDWRNRERAPQYRAAVNDMFRLTSTPFAPWHILESNNKYYARIKALKIINEALENRMK